MILFLSSQNLNIVSLYVFQSEDSTMGVDMTSGNGLTQAKRLPQYIATISGS